MAPLYPVSGSAYVTASDFPDPDVIRVEDAWYMISTTMYFLPGGVLLRSFDLLHWEVCGHVFDRLEDNPAWRLEDGKNVYAAGMWAASLRYHKGSFYAVFCANDSRMTYLFRAADPAGPAGDQDGLAFERKRIGIRRHTISVLNLRQFSGPCRSSSKTRRTGDRWSRKRHLPACRNGRGDNSPCLSRAARR